MMPLRPPLTIITLSDNFGQYVLTLKCECGHVRNAQPRTLAAIAGWDASLQEVVKRLRCSRCGKRRCTATVRPETNAMVRSSVAILNFIVHVRREALPV
jgi:hypothetical protein